MSDDGEIVRLITEIRDAQREQIDWAREQMQRNQKIYQDALNRQKRNTILIVVLGVIAVVGYLLSLTVSPT